MVYGPARAHSRWRVYMIHARPPEFRWRAICIDRGTGLPEAGEQRAEIVSGLVHGVDYDTNLAEFDWIDRPAVEEFLAALLGSTTVISIGVNSLRTAY